MIISVYQKHNDGNNPVFIPLHAIVYVNTRCTATGIYVYTEAAQISTKNWSRKKNEETEAKIVTFGHLSFIII